MTRRPGGARRADERVGAWPSRVTRATPAVPVVRRSWTVCRRVAQLECGAGRRLRSPGLPRPPDATTAQPRLNRPAGPGAAGHDGLARLTWPARRRRGLERVGVTGRAAEGQSADAVDVAAMRAARSCRSGPDGVDATPARTHRDPGARDTLDCKRRGADAAVGGSGRRPAGAVEDVGAERGLARQRGVAEVRETEDVLDAARASSSGCRGLRDGPGAMHGDSSTAPTSPPPGPLIPGSGLPGPGISPQQALVSLVAASSKVMISRPSWRKAGEAVICGTTPAGTCWPGRARRAGRWRTGRRGRRRTGRA